MAQGHSKEQREFSNAVVIIAFGAFVALTIVLMLQAWGFIPLSNK